MDALLTIWSQSLVLKPLESKLHLVRCDLLIIAFAFCQIEDEEIKKLLQTSLKPKKKSGAKKAKKANAAPKEAAAEE